MNQSSQVPNDGRSPEPFVHDLPQAGSDYFQILGKESAVTMRSGLVTLKSGEKVGSHNTDDYEELIVILAGKGQLETEGLGRRAIAAGQVAYNPPHTQHNVHNTGSDILRYIYVVSKA
jgi:quercetin dioxygenase-like cupin family protein